MPDSAYRTMQYSSAYVNFPVRPDILMSRNMITGFGCMTTSISTTLCIMGEQVSVSVVGYNKKGL